MWLDSYAHVGDSPRSPCRITRYTRSLSLKDSITGRLMLTPTRSGAGKSGCPQGIDRANEKWSGFCCGVVYIFIDPPGFFGARNQQEESSCPMSSLRRMAWWGRPTEPRGALRTWWSHPAEGDGGVKHMFLFLFFRVGGCPSFHHYFFVFIQDVVDI